MSLKAVWRGQQGARQYACRLDEASTVHAAKRVGAHRGLANCKEGAAAGADLVRLARSRVAVHYLALLQPWTRLQRQCAVPHISEACIQLEAGPDLFGAGN